MKQELLKILDARIIYPIKHSYWVANLFLVKKQMEKLDVCRF